MNYQAIYNDRQLPEYSSLTPAEFVEARNDKSITRWNDVPMPDVLNFFVTVNPSTQIAPWDDLEAAVANTNFNGFLRAAIKRLLITAQSNIPVLSYETEELVDYLPYVVMLEIISQETADAFLDLSRYYVSPAEIEYGADITEQDVLIADRLPQTEQLATLRQQVAEAYNRVVTAIDTAEQNGEVPDFAALVDEFAGEAI